MADVQTLLKMGGLVVLGFFAHKALTGGALRLATSTDAASGATTIFGQSTVGADGKPSFVAIWQKPIMGLALGGLGVWGLSAAPMKSDTRMSMGAGIVTSFLQSLVHTLLTVADQPQVLSYLEGYQNSAAYALRGTRGRRRGFRGLGVARHATSIMPQYAPVGASYQQAQAGMGEYFASQSGMGEYFAGPGVEGVGHYEKAGPLALLPSTSHMGQLPIDDGIRPDANLDSIMTLAESAAGLGQGYRQAAAGLGQGYRQAAAGMGEYFSAAPQGDGFKEFTVPTQSQWIPSGPLWAGTMNADAAYTESELPAGILQGPGGNGVLSG